MRKAVFEREESGVRIYRTVSGVPVLIRRKPELALTYLGVYALGGSRDENAENAGITALMARTAVKGTARRNADQIAMDAEMLGGSIGWSAGVEQFGWGFSVPARHTAAAVDLLSDVVLRASFVDEAIVTERGLMLAELEAMRDDMYRYPTRLAVAAAFSGHPYGLSTAGSESSVRALTGSGVRAWHQAHVLRAPMVLAAVTDLDPDNVAAVMADAFGELQMVSPEPLAAPVWPSAPIVQAESRDKSQTALTLLFPGPSRKDPDRAAAKLIGAISSGLGGRLFDELRDRQSLAYTVYASASARMLSGMFVAYMATSPAAEPRAREGLLKELHRLSEEPVPEEELTRAKTYTIGSHAIALQSGGAVLGEMIDAYLLGTGLSELTSHDESVRAVTPAAIQRVAQNAFRQDRVVEGVIRGKQVS